jgi:hypothetical protein
MSKSASLLAARILAELEDIGITVERAGQGWERAKTKNDEYYLDGVALNLHGFYSGLERIFERIGAAVDGSVPSGANWHRELLNQMSIEIPGVRPAVISEGLRENLEGYLGFRHVVRNVYTYHLSPEKLEALVAQVQTVFVKAKSEMAGFCKFLQNSE